MTNISDHNPKHKPLFFLQGVTKTNTKMSEIFMSEKQIKAYFIPGKKFSTEA